MTADDKTIDEYIKTFGQDGAIRDSVASVAALITGICNVQTREKVTSVDRLNLAGNMANAVVAIGMLKEVYGINDDCLQAFIDGRQRADKMRISYRKGGGNDNTM